MAGVQVPTKGMLRGEAERVAELNRPQGAGEDRAEWRRRVTVETDRILAAEMGWLERIQARGGPELVAALRAPVRAKVETFKVRMPGPAAAEAARAHQAAFGHLPTDREGRTVRVSGAAVKAERCAVCRGDVPAPGVWWRDGVVAGLEVTDAAEHERRSRVAVEVGCAHRAAVAAVEVAPKRAKRAPAKRKDRNGAGEAGARTDGG